MVASVIIVIKVGVLLGHLADSGIVLVREIICCYGDILKTDKSIEPHQIKTIISLISMSLVFSHCSIVSSSDCSCTALVGPSHH
jgi:hypothetical protein